MSRYKLIILGLLFPVIALGQIPTEKVVNEQTQTWVSLNTVTKFSDHWGIVADAHIRSNEVFHDNNFYFLRGGISYIPNPAVSITGGYAHMWLAPTKEGWIPIRMKTGFTNKRK